MRTPKELTEMSFEEYIEDHLLKSGYIKGSPQDYNKEYAFDTKMLFDFLEDTQPEKLQKLKETYKDQYKYKIILRLNRELQMRGMIDVLRHGIKDYGVYLELAYFKPASSMNREMVALYGKNRISVTRQLKYSVQNENSVDMGIFVNGLPVVVLELKNEYTGQNVQNAVWQFRNDRNPTQPLFQFKERAIIFFAVDTSEVYMTTRLAKEKTFFLPFNKGKNNGSGNPENPDGFKTAYLWEEVLQIDSLLDIIKRFVFVESEEREDENGKTFTVQKIVFPRYHQLDSVRKLESKVKEDGVGASYLIQHSAGSGKTNSISWLSHRLASIHDAEDLVIFDSVIVITDRKVLDRQLQESIYQLEHKHGVVEKIEHDSSQLADALKSGVRIIITTLQKFPYVLDKAGELGERRCAVIIDEAHSSTTGKNISALTETLAITDLEAAAKEEAVQEYDPDEEILKAIRKTGKQPNISFFAFTATPKAKTLEMFGTPGSDGLPKPFHLYSMRQAIEEGFILDVLKNYATYATYFKIAKQIEDDPAFDKAKATKALTRFVSLHPHNIAQKTQIIIEHFRKVSIRKIDGRAKAMVVTSSRLHAVRYKIAFDDYIKKQGYTDLKALVAFSGTVKDGEDYTESSMNTFADTQTPQKFDTDEYRVLLVAEKYQTGFDQPLLHTMYVDKKLTGVKAVQTLSRLNRTYLGKKDTFILDFVNEAEDIQASFKPYFETTFIEEVSEPNLLYDIEAKLRASGIYMPDEVNKFAEVFYKLKENKSARDKAILNHYTDIAVDRFKAADEDIQITFYDQAVKFEGLYSFIIQITPFEDVDLHKLYLYLSFLLRKLPRGTQSAVKVSDEVAMEYYKVSKIFDGDLSLEAGGEYTAVPPVNHPGSKKKEDEKESLSAIIDRLNARFGTDFTMTDQLTIEQIKEDFVKDPDMVRKAKNNSVEDFKYAFEKAFISKVIERMDQNQAFFAKVLDDEEFKDALMGHMLTETYQKLNQMTA